MLKHLLAGVLFLCSCCAGFAQQDKVNALVARTVKSDSLVIKNGPEKLYIQFDKPYYATGDTIWLKAWIFDGPTYLLSSRSGLLHVDIANDSNKIIKQYLFPVFDGLSWSNLALDEKVFRPGDYTLRAYTNWMRNFGDDAFFFKRIRIAGTNENGWLVNSEITRDSANVKAELRLTAMNKLPLADSAIDVELVNGKKIISRQRIKTDRNGVVGLSFSSPGATKPAIVLQNSSKTKKVIIPVILNRPENTDVQFMPEGGSMIAGLPARIGFKAIVEDGRGALVSRVVVDAKDSIVGSFRSLHNGMGSFYMQPQAGENYRAKVNLPGAVIRYYPLPSVKGSGTLLQVKNLPGTDSLDVIVAATPDYANASYYLIGKVRGLTCYAAVADLRKDPYQRSRIAKSKFPEGIAHFILMTAAGQPLNERLVYVDHPDSLHIDIEPDRQVYNPKDSITLHIRVNDNTGKPATGNFSMTVTDDAQVRGDSVSDENIITRILLTSDLKGYVENPGYYFMDNDTAKLALDNLLLTQGWVSYEPTVSMQFKPEKEFTVQGVVNNLFRAPVKKTHVVLFSRSPAMLFDTVTNSEGHFIFDRFPRVDTPVFVLKAVNRAGKSFNVNIDVDEYKSPPFIAPKMRSMMPWYVNTDTAMMNQVKNSTLMRQAAIPGGGR
ncbi:MAG TPA: hypothetical protein VHS53_14175 [Mucilaginibacter sp.]|nr:hypothetical protein [Mucilaginibacter sp.]